MVGACWKDDCHLGQEKEHKHIVFVHFWTRTRTQSLLRLKQWLASGTGGRKDATYFSADAENNFLSLVSSGLFQICGEANQAGFYFIGRAEFAFSTSVEFSSTGYHCGLYMFLRAYRVRRPGGADTSSFSKIIPRLFDIILEHFEVPRDQLSLGLHKTVQGGYAAVVKLVLEMGKPGVESKASDQTPLSWGGQGRTRGGGEAAA